MFDLLILCSVGLEKVTIKELKKLDIKSSKIKGGMIKARCPIDKLYKINLSVRTAERVLIIIGEFIAENFDDLYEKTYRLNWEDYIYDNSKVVIDKLRSSNSKLFALTSIQSVIQKAIYEKLTSYYKKSSMEESGSIQKVRVYIFKDKVTVGLDISGEPLHKRGYRKLIGKAPMKETIAAGLILLSDWNDFSIPLFDPFCGSGTIPIEAMMYAMNYPVNINRSFSLENLKIHEADKFNRIKKDLLEKVDYNIRPYIFGSDIEKSNIEISEKNYESLKIDKKIIFKTFDFKDLYPSTNKVGIFVTNAPFGERIGDKKAAIEIYKEISKFLVKFKGWEFCIFSSEKDTSKYLNKKYKTMNEIQNGIIKSYFFRF